MLFLNNFLNPHQAGVSESLIRRGGGGKYAPQGKLAIFAIILHSRQQKHIKGLKGHKGGPLLGPGPVLVLQWTLQGP